MVGSPPVSLVVIYTAVCVALPPVHFQRPCCLRPLEYVSTTPICRMQPSPSTCALPHERRAVRSASNQRTVFIAAAPAPPPICRGQALRCALVFRVRKFFCRNRACAQRIFAERLPTVVAPRARSTVRLTTVWRMVAFALGGEAGARLLARLRMPTSPDTLLALIRQTVPAAHPTPRVLGIEDWAIRKGQTYGTIVVDLERHQVVDLLHDRPPAHGSAITTNRCAGTGRQPHPRWGSREAVAACHTYPKRMSGI